MSDPFLHQAIHLAFDNVEQGGRPFGAVVVKNGKPIATGVNETVQSHDPTAHAELVAIRRASQALGSPDLAGCEVYASGQPCPMCLAAMHLAGISKVVFAYSNDDGAPYGLSTASLAAEMEKPWNEQSLPVSHIPDRLDGRPDLYAKWHQDQSSR